MSIMGLPDTRHSKSCQVKRLSKYSGMISQSPRRMASHCTLLSLMRVSSARETYSNRLSELTSTSSPFFKRRWDDLSLNEIRNFSNIFLSFPSKSSFEHCEINVNVP